MRDQVNLGQRTLPTRAERVNYQGAALDHRHGEWQWSLRAVPWAISLVV